MKKDSISVYDRGERYERMLQYLYKKSTSVYHLKRGTVSFFSTPKPWTDTTRLTTPGGQAHAYRQTRTSTHPHAPALTNPRTHAYEHTEHYKSKITY